MNKMVVKLLNWILLLAYTPGMIFFLIKGNIAYSSIFIIAFLASLISSFFIKHKKLPEYYLLFVNLFIWADLIGEVFRVYYIFIYYDKILHFIVPLLLAEMATFYFRMKKVRIGLAHIFMMIMGILALFEMYEYTLDYLLHMTAMGVLINSSWVMSPLADTMADLACGALGAIVFLIIYWIKDKGKHLNFI